MKRYLFPGNSAGLDCTHLEGAGSYDMMSLLHHVCSGCAGGFSGEFGRRWESSGVVARCCGCSL